MIVALESCSIRHPFLFRFEVLAVELEAKSDHFVELVLQALLVGSYLPEYFVSVEAEYELGLVAYGVVPCDLGGDIRVDLDDLEEAVVGCKSLELLVGDGALRVPAGSEVDQSMGVLVLEKVLVKALEAVEAVQV